MRRVPTAFEHRFSGQNKRKHAVNLFKSGACSPNSEVLGAIRGNIVPHAARPHYCRAMNDNVEILGECDLYKGYFRIALYRYRHRLFAGGWSSEIKREVFERGHAAGLLPYDPERDAVVLIEQFRIGALTAGMPPWQIEVVAGIIEDGETAEDVARRESWEEAGATVSELMPMCRYLVSPGGTSESVALFCGRVDSRGLGGIHGLPEENEDIRVEVVPFAEAMRLLTEGRIGNAVGIIALQWLALNRDRVRAAWR
jgi:ADP-ribose pyrophosphatase